MSNSALSVLFLCTGNSARSILGEYLLRRHGEGRIETLSAGARPTGCVHPLALRVLREDYDIDAGDACSESVDLYVARDLDVVVTVCDHARDICPVFPRRVVQVRGLVQVHWGSPDPAACTGPDDEALTVFRDVAGQIDGRVRRFAELTRQPGFAEIDARVLGERLGAIAEA